MVNPKEFTGAYSGTIKSGAQLASNISNNSTQLAKAILGVIKTGNVIDGSGKLTFSTRQALNTALKHLTNPSKRAILIKAIGSAVAKGIISAGSSTAEIAAAVISPMYTAQVQQKREAEQTQRQAIASSERIQLKAIEAGVWNKGLNANPNKDEGSEGNGSGDETTGGSFLGG